MALQKEITNENLIILNVLTKFRVNKNSGGGEGGNIMRGQKTIV